MTRRFSRGMSTPAIRAMGFLLFFRSSRSETAGCSTLPLLVAGGVADDLDATVTPDDPALVAHLLDAGSNLHRVLSLQPLLVAVGDPTPGEVVWRQLNLH